MLRRLRWRLTALYTGAGLLLILLMGTGAYGVLDYYFRLTTDQALHHRMAHDVAELGLPLPPELLAADRDWYARRGKQATPSTPLPASTALTSTLWSGYPSFTQLESSEDLEEYYDGEMAAMFVLPLDAGGQVVFDPNPVAWAYPPHQAAVAAARTRGRDLRTVHLPTGERVRQLTYKLVRQEEVGFLQIGRALDDQDRVLNYLWLTLLGLGTVAMIGIGVGSWWLAGRSIRPAQQAWTQQQAFIANASHELRTPLTLLRASIEVIQSEWPGANAFNQHILRDALAECDHMRQLIDDLLTLARLDEGKLALRQEPVELPRLFDDIQRQLARLATERTIHLKVATAPIKLTTDPVRLRQVILIALDNALRHTPAGGQVDLTAHLTRQKVQITVGDNGEGIPPHHLPHLFDRFYRVHSTHSAETKGSGLGLAIAAGLVKAMGGELTLTSQEGQGTQVVFLFPHHHPRAANLPASDDLRPAA